MTFEVRSVTVDIEAPQAFVWDVLLDYPRYPEWNPYTVRVESTCAVGDPVDLYLPDPNRPGELMHQREWVCAVDPPHRFAYEMRPSGLRDAMSSYTSWVVMPFSSAVICR